MAFDENERSDILLTNIAANNNQSFGTAAGNDTKDKIFLLSEQEVQQYASHSKCEPTQYAVAQGAACNDSGFCTWWLRSPGKNRHLTGYVTKDGSVFSFGRNVIRESCVRPAIWVDISE